MARKWHSVVIDSRAFGMEFWAQDNDGGNLFRITKDMNGPVYIKLPDGSTHKAKLFLQEGDGCQDDILTIDIRLHNQKMEINAEDFEEGFSVFVEEKREYFVLYRREVYLQPILVKKTADIPELREAAARVKFGELESCVKLDPVFKENYGCYSVAESYCDDLLAHPHPVVLSSDPSEIKNKDIARADGGLLTKHEIESAWDDITSDNSEEVSINEDALKCRK